MAKHTLNHGVLSYTETEDQSNGDRPKHVHSPEVVASIQDRLGLVKSIAPLV
jgi:hypothetical protein